MIPTRKKNNRPVSLNPLKFETSVEGLEKLKKADNPTDYYKSLLTCDELLALEIEERQYLLKGLIAEETITLINGGRGVGKSMFAWNIASAVSAGVDFGPWGIEHSVDTLIIDGEMSIMDAHKRVLQLRQQKRLSELYVWSDALGYRVGIKRMNLLDAVCREHIRANVLDLGIKLVILDNLSSLCPGIDENSKLDFDPINRWLLEMRYDRVTICMVHHTGKTGSQRGTSAHEDHVDAVILLTAVEPESNGCKFNLKVDKDRSKIIDADHVTLEAVDREDGSLVLVPCYGSAFDKALHVLRKNPEILVDDFTKMGFSRSTFFRAKKWLYRNQKTAQKRPDFWIMAETVS